MKNIKIYVVTNKNYKLYENEVYTPITVGNADLPYIRDNTGQNISTKNESFCELTALYWIWKNGNNDIVGINHYSRYFQKKYSFGRVIPAKEIDEVLKVSDMIIPTPYSTEEFTVEEQYCFCHKKEDYNKCRELIYEKYPQYSKTFETVSRRKQLYICNMFITNNNILDEYSSWLFPILFELENRIDTSNYDKYNKRVIGFIAERLFNVWLEENSKIKTETRKIIRK